MNRRRTHFSSPNPSAVSVAALVLSVLAVGCNSVDDTASADAGSHDDTGTTDTSATDTSAIDTGTPTDGGALDSGSVDAGDSGDSGASDTTAPASSSDLFLQKFEITNASTGKGGATVSDYSTKIIAGAVHSVTSEDASCIDLRSTGFSGSGSLIVSETVIALLHAPLSDASNKAISVSICALGPSSCKVVISVAHPSLAESLIEEPLFGSDGFETGRLHFVLDGHGVMPRMSNACVSGLYVDSWNHFAHTKEAKTYLTSLGIDLTTSASPQLALVQSKGTTYEHLFSFGFID